MDFEERLKRLDHHLAGNEREDAEALALDYFDSVRGTHADSGHAEAILKRFKGARYFRELSAIAERAIRSRATAPIVYTLYGQGLIDQGFVDAGIDLLAAKRPLAENDRERSEFGGLLGRGYKQRFVDAAAAGHRREDDLRRAIESYREVYPLDRAWHGANLVALVCRAERDGIPLDLGETAASLAERVIDEIVNEPGEATYWQTASIAEASLALDDWESVTRHYTDFVRHPEADPFALGSAIRQLREVWKARPGEDDPVSRILTQLQIKALSYPQGGGEVTYTPAEGRRVLQAIEANEAEDLAQSFGNLEAIHGDNKQVPAYVMRRLLEREDAVCRVVDRNRHPYTPSGGTGFMIDAADLIDAVPEADRAAWSGPLLVTNNHVLSDDGRPPSVRTRLALAVFDNRGLAFPIDRILWSSPREELDVSIASLDWDGNEARPKTIPINRDPEPLTDVSADETADKIYVVGHPMGRGLEFSLADNVIVDHEFVTPGVPELAYRRIHYGAPTERGNSGSPVLDEHDFEVIGVHRAIAKNPLRERSDLDPYSANEAVAAISVKAALAGGGNR